ncbi:MAG: hypothetical protein CMJ44_13305 [Pimelobacter sp.]|nr:hypothetical protein [Pimelobacter sp.]
MFTTVESAYGHRFISTDSDGHESCLTCGALFELTDRGDGTGIYTTAYGDEPERCTGDTGMAHGYPGERYCHEHQHPLDYDEHECSHVDHRCNCLLCM